MNSTPSARLTRYMYDRDKLQKKDGDQDRALLHVPLNLQVVAPHLVADAEGVKRAEGVGPCHEREAGRPERRRRLQHHAPHALPAFIQRPLFSEADMPHVHNTNEEAG